MSTLQERQSIEALTDQLRGELNSIHDEARSYCDFIDESPDLSRMLTEYAAACHDTDEHFKRFAGQPGKWEEQSDECRADWSRCCSRKHAAEDAIARFAKVYVALKSESEAA